jgi:hypothetical protein
MKKLSPYFLVFTVGILSGCSSSGVKVEPTKVVPGEKVQELVEVEKLVPSTWQLPQFEEQWSKASTEADQIQVLKDLQKFAAPDFDAWSFWQGFANQKYLWPKPESIQAHRELLNLQKLSCDAPVVNAFALFTLAVSNSSQPEAIRSAYLAAGFGASRLCSTAPSVELSLQNLEIVLRSVSQLNAESVLRAIDAIELLETAIRFYGAAGIQGTPLSQASLKKIEELGLSLALFEDSSSAGSRLITLAYSLSRHSRLFLPLKEGIFRSAFGSNESTERTLRFCLQSTECRLSDLLGALANEPHHFYESLSEEDLLVRAEAIHQIVNQVQIDSVIEFYNELKTYLQILQKIEVQIPNRAGQLYVWGQAAVERIDAYFASRSPLVRATFRDWLVFRRASDSPILDSWILSGLTEKSRWEDRALIYLRAPSAEALWLRWRSLMRLSVASREMWEERKSIYCSFLNQLGFSGGDITEKELNQTLKSKDGLSAGCWNLIGNKEAIAISAASLRMSPDSLLSTNGTSLVINSDSAALGVLDLSSVAEVVEAPLDRENSESRMARSSVIFPILFTLSVDGAPSVSSECKVGGRGYVNQSTDPLKPQFIFCPGEHMGVFHFPLQISQDAPDVTESPQVPPSGGSLDLTKSVVGYQSFQFISFGTKALSPIPAEMGGLADRSFALSAFGNSETGQESFKSFVASYQHLVTQRPIYFHERLRTSELQALFAQVFNGAQVVADIVVPLGYLDLLHKQDRAQILRICGASDGVIDEEMLKDCFARLSPLINERINEILRMSPDDYTVFRRFDHPLVSKVSFEGEDGSDFFSSRDSVFLYGGQDGDAGPAGQSGVDGRLLLNESTSGSK